MKRIIVGLAIILLLVISPSAHANSTIFSDDFLSSGFPVQWGNFFTASNSPQNGASQANGYATVVSQRSSFGSGTFSVGGMIANTSIANSPFTAADGQFILMSWKMQAFNMTANPSTVNKVGELLFGFSIYQNIVSAPNMIAFDLFTSDLSTCGAPGPCSSGSKSAIFLDITGPMAGAAKCFDVALSLYPEAGGCQPAPQYSSPTNPIDLNNPQHIFTIEMKLYPVSHTSWIAFNVDSMAWINMTQKACSCIDQTAAGGSYVTMYPFVALDYFAGGGGCCINGILPTQSLAANIDWVSVYDYVPPFLPSGQLLFSNTNPPSSLPNPFNTFGPSDSLVAFMVFQANSFAPGNIYAGGMLLLGLTVGVMGFVLGGLVYRSKIGLGSMGFMWTLGSLGICFFFFYCQIVPLWLPVMQTVVTAGIVFGIIRTGGASGGVVPD